MDISKITLEARHLGFLYMKYSLHTMYIYSWTKTNLGRDDNWRMRTDDPVKACVLFGQVSVTSSWSFIRLTKFDL